MAESKISTFTLAMETMNRPLKRQRVLIGESQEATNNIAEELDLGSLVSSRNWVAAAERAKSHPEEASSSKDPSPLALACRLGAPYPCVNAILQACPSRLRHLLDSRGTPLHEAVVSYDAGPEVIERLLKADEKLGSDTPRTTVMQDVDGYTPLHLLIRRRFQAHILGSDEGSHLMELLEMLVKSCAEAVVVPDRGEYEEPPIVMALKANVYAPLVQSEDATAARIERNIFEMVNCMLQHYPIAAGCVFNGYRGKYTALHSAVFHGRCPDTIGLLLQAESRSPSSQKAGLLANTQGELPLHFCAMRGEPPRSVALLAEAAPEAVASRDASGLTPVHWLWIRFVSTLLAIDDGGRGSNVTMPLERRAGAAELSEYLSFATLEQGDFEADLLLVRRLDPSVDFLRMRHIPGEVLDESDAFQWAERTAVLLQQVRDRYERSISENETPNGNDVIVWSRIEAAASLFWTKVVSLLKAASDADSASYADSSINSEEFSLVRTAFQSICCPPPVALIVASMYPQEMLMPDVNGRLPLHHAARRAWHAWDWPRDDVTSEAASAQVLQLETISLLKTAMSLYPVEAARHKDKFCCLPIHYAIPTFVRAFCSSGRSSSENPVTDILDLISCFVQMNPDSLHECDPRTGLFPFLQASAVAAEAKSNSSTGSFPDELALSVVYQLLHQNPSLVKVGMAG